MQEVLRNLESFSSAYIDDVIIFFLYLGKIISPTFIKFCPGCHPMVLLSKTPSVAGVFPPLNFWVTLLAKAKFLFPTLMFCNWKIMLSPRQSLNWDHSSVLQIFTGSSYLVLLRMRSTWQIWPDGVAPRTLTGTTTAMMHFVILFLVYHILCLLLFLYCMIFFRCTVMPPWVA